MHFAELLWKSGNEAAQGSLSQALHFQSGWVQCAVATHETTTYCSSGALPFSTGGGSMWQCKQQWTTVRLPTHQTPFFGNGAVSGIPWDGSFPYALHYIRKNLSWMRHVTLISDTRKVSLGHTEPKVLKLLLRTVKLGLKAGQLPLKELRKSCDATCRNSQNLHFIIILLALSLQEEVQLWSPPSCLGLCFSYLRQALAAYRALILLCQIPSAELIGVHNRV